MAQAMTTQNQNVQLTKTFFVAFAGMLLAVPIVTLITASIVQAQFGSLVHAAAQAPQSNSLVAGPSCEAPVDDPAVAGTQTNKAGKNLFAKATKWLPFGQSNYSSTSTTTNTTNNTSTVTIRDNGNTFAPTNIQSWSNTQTWNANGNSFNSGNTNNTAVITNTDLSNNSVNTTVNDNSNQGNDHSTNTTVIDNSTNDSYNTDVNVEIDAELDIL